MNLEIPVCDGKIGVAVSGGIDSMCLLHLFLSSGKDIVALNVEHGIRGDSSVRDTDFVRNYCRICNVPFISRSVNVPENRLPGESTETCARRLRYEFFEELLANKAVDKIALAHHADDNAETVLMRIFRGTGIHGLVGITDRGAYIRPLISYTRKQIEEYASAHSVPFVTDETNLSSDYTRNFIRNDLMPLIASRFGDVPAAVSRLSACASEADEYLFSVCPRAKKQIDGYHLNDLFGYPVVLQKYAILQVMRELGIVQDFEMRHIDSIIELQKKPTNTSIDLPFGLVCVKYGDGVIFAQNSNSEFISVPFALGKYEHAGRRYTVKIGSGLVRGASIDGDRLPDGCVVRTRLDGDEFKRVNGKRKLLGDYLGSLKLPKTEKDGVLVLARGKTVYAVFGYDTADQVKITDNTTHIIHILEEKTK